MTLLLRIAKTALLSLFVIKHHFRTLFWLFVTFLGVYRGVLSRFAHLFQDIPFNTPSLAGLKVTFLVFSRGIKNRPIHRQELHLFSGRLEPGPRAAFRTIFCHFLNYQQ